MIGHIYLIRNLIDGKGYVGQTVQPLAKRFILHKSDARLGSSGVLHRAMRKYGFKNFSIILVVTCDALLMNDLEEHYIKFYGTFISGGHGYNLTRGGSSSFQMSDETKLKMSKSKMGKKRGPHSIEHKTRISESQKGNRNGEGRKGSIQSANTKIKIALAHRKRLAHNKGKVMPTERET